MPKFHNDPMVNESEIVIFLRQVWWSAGKERVLKEREGKTKLRGREAQKLSPNISLFISKILTTYYLLYLFIFIILYK